MEISFHSHANKSNFYLESFAGSFTFVMRFKTTRKLNPLRVYHKVPIVVTFVTFGISSLLGLLLSVGRYFQGNKNHETKLALALFHNI